MADGANRLERFVAAQDEGRTYERALVELRAGRKDTHWMWFVFPQLAGLGSSPTARRYAISSLDEAVAYLAHPILGPRLTESSLALLELAGRTAESILGALDAQKLRSSMTLFARASADGPPFGDVLEQYFEGRGDPLTEQLLVRG